MKVMRYFVSLLLLLTGVLHSLPFFKGTPYDVSTQMLAFGIIYFVLGGLLMLNRNFSPAWGIIFPLIGLVAGLSTIGIENLNLMLTSLFAIDAIVIICCIFLFYKKNEINRD